jgi:hypothetical protein
MMETTRKKPAGRALIIPNHRPSFGKREQSACTSNPNPAPTRESNHNAKSNLMQLSPVSRLLRLRNSIEAETHRPIKMFRTTIRGQHPKCD